MGATFLFTAVFVLSFRSPTSSRRGGLERLPGDMMPTSGQAKPTIISATFCSARTSLTRASNSSASRCSGLPSSFSVPSLSLHPSAAGFGWPYNHGAAPRTNECGQLLCCKDKSAFGWAGRARRCGSSRPRSSGSTSPSCWASAATPAPLSRPALLAGPHCQPGDGAAQGRRGGGLGADRQPLASRNYRAHSKHLWIDGMDSAGSGAVLCCAGLG